MKTDRLKKRTIGFSLSVKEVSLFLAYSLLMLNVLFVTEIKAQPTGVSEVLMQADFETIDWNINNELTQSVTLTETTGCILSLDLFLDGNDVNDEVLEGYYNSMDEVSITIKNAITNELLFEVFIEHSFRDRFDGDDLVFRFEDNFSNLGGDEIHFSGASNGYIVDAAFDNRAWNLPPGTYTFEMNVPNTQNQPAGFTFWEPNSSSILFNATFTDPVVPAGFERNPPSLRARYNPLDGDILDTTPGEWSVVEKLFSGNFRESLDGLKSRPFRIITRTDFKVLYRLAFFPRPNYFSGGNFQEVIGAHGIVIRDFYTCQKVFEIGLEVDDHCDDNCYDRLRWWAEDFVHNKILLEREQNISETNLVVSVGSETLDEDLRLEPGA